jgi:hypothetical protein
VSARVEMVSRNRRALSAWALAPRVALLAATLVLALAGLHSIVVRPRAVAPMRVSAPVDQAADGFAVEFARAYLSFDATHPDARLRALAALGASSEADAPPEGGRRSVVWALAVQDERAIAGGRIVTVAAQTDDATAPTYLAVPVRRVGGALALGGYPSIVGPPLTLSGAPAQHVAVTDPQLRTVAARVVRNYLARDRQDLDADLASRALVTLPTAPFAVASTDEVAWADRAHTGVLVTVEAASTRGENLTFTYELGVNRHERWYVDSIEVIPSST